MKNKISIFELLTTVAEIKKILKKQESIVILFTWDKKQVMLKFLKKETTEEQILKIMRAFNKETNKLDIESLKKAIRKNLN